MKMSRNWPISQSILERNSRWIPGGVVSLNRRAEPHICFVRGRGSYVWDAEGNRYIDYQAGFAACFLGHNDPDVNEAVHRVLQEDRVLMGAGPSEMEGTFAELFCRCVPTAESLQITSTGSEATYHALRISRAVTGREHIVKIQGGYNGWYNDVAGNVISTAADAGPRQEPGEYPFDALSAGIPEGHKELVHVVNFNDLDSMEQVLRRYPVAGIILEPILQNIGVVKPRSGYLEGLRKLADRYGALLIFDEVKTGFRHALGGYQAICGVTPDLSTFGKAVANGYPMGVIAGKRRYLDAFTDPNRSRRALIAGTYNAHPVPTAAGIATLKKLADPQYDVYGHLEKLGTQLESGLREIFRDAPFPVTVVRQGSAFCVYFMDHAPTDYHDILKHHDFERDRRYRLGLISRGIYHFPLPIKQGSISYAHTAEDIAETLRVTGQVWKNELRQQTIIE